MSDWKPSAACRNEDPDLFFAEGRGSRGQVQAAQAVCLRCPVRRECGEDALRRGEFWGVWGGMSQQQLRTRRQRYGHSSEVRTTPKPKSARKKRAAV